jgi:hypothetical protein
MKVISIDNLYLFIDAFISRIVKYIFHCYCIYCTFYGSNRLQKFCLMITGKLVGIASSTFTQADWPWWDVAEFGMLFSEWQTSLLISTQYSLAQNTKSYFCLGGEILWIEGSVFANYAPAQPATPFCQALLFKVRYKMQSTVHFAKYNHALKQTIWCHVSTTITSSSPRNTWMRKWRVLNRAGQGDLVEIAE